MRICAKAQSTRLESRSRTYKVAVLLSGGVDSAVAALLMKERGFALPNLPAGGEGGFEIEGFFMDIGINGRDAKFCLPAIASAKEGVSKVADSLNIKLNIIDVSQEFNERVIDYFKKEYRELRTPNPCVACNQAIKFGVLYNEIIRRGFEVIATGHYIRKVQSSKFTRLDSVDPRRKVQKNTKNQKLNIEDEGELQVMSYKLQAAKDQRKDQSYFLYNLTQEHLKHLEFPLGDLTKDEVFEIARKNNIPVAEKESYDICFLRGDHNKYLQKHLDLNPGPIIDKTGKEIGQHFGLPLYAIGQRRWIKIGGTGPYYVLRTDLETNTLFVTDRFDDEELYSDEFEVESANWINESSKFKVQSSKFIKVKIRYLHPSVKVDSIEEVGEGRLRVKLAEKQRAVTRGQSAVFYGEDGEVLGGGIID